MVGPLTHRSAGPADGSIPTCWPRPTTTAPRRLRPYQSPIQRPAAAGRSTPTSSADRLGLVADSPPATLLRSRALYERRDRSGAAQRWARVIAKGGLADPQSAAPQPCSSPNSRRRPSRRASRRSPDSARLRASPGCGEPGGPGGSEQVPGGLSKLVRCSAPFAWSLLQRPGSLHRAEQERAPRGGK